MHWDFHFGCPEQVDTTLRAQAAASLFVADRPADYKRDADESTVGMFADGGNDAENVRPTRPRDGRP